MSQPTDQAGLPVKAQFKFSADELIRGLKAHSKSNYELTRFIPYLGGFMILSFFFTWYRQDFMSAIPLALLGTFFVSIKIITYWGCRRRFRTNPNKNETISWVFSSDKIFSEGVGFDHSMAWSKVFKFIDSPEGFLIYPQKQLFYWIPFSGFQSESEIECVRKMAKSQVTDYKRSK